MGNSGARLRHLPEDLFFGDEVVVADDGVLEHGGGGAEVQAALGGAGPFAGGVDVGGDEGVAHADGVDDVGDVEDLRLVDGALEP